MGIATTVNYYICKGLYELNPHICSFDVNLEEEIISFLLIWLMSWKE